jgi:hypothetical protein
VRQASVDVSIVDRSPVIPCICECTLIPSPDSKMLEARPIPRFNATRCRLCGGVCTLERPGDVMALIEQDISRLEHRDRNGGWPPDMSRNERRHLEANLALIVGTSR